MDDDPIITYLIPEYLRSRGNSDVFVASSSNEALFLSRVYQPDYIIMDYNMPGENRLNTCQELRRLGFPKYIVGMSSDNVSQEWLNVGANAFLPKKKIIPNLAELLNNLERSK